MENIARQSDLRGPADRARYVMMTCRFLAVGSMIAVASSVLAAVRATAEATATVALEVVRETAQARLRDVVMRVVDMEAEAIVVVRGGGNGFGVKCGGKEAAARRRERGRQWLEGHGHHRSVTTAFSAAARAGIETSR